MRAWPAAVLGPSAVASKQVSGEMAMFINADISTFTSSPRSANVGFLLFNVISKFILNVSWQANNAFLDILEGREVSGKKTKFMDSVAIVQTNSSSIPTWTSAVNWRVTWNETDAAGTRGTNDAGVVTGLDPMVAQFFGCGLICMLLEQVKALHVKSLTYRSRKRPAKSGRWPPYKRLTKIYRKKDKMMIATPS